MFIWCILIYIHFVIGEHRFSRIILGPTGQMVVSLWDDTRSWIVIGMIIYCTYHWYESYIILLRIASPGCQIWACESYGTRGGRSTRRNRILHHAVMGVRIYSVRLYPDIFLLLDLFCVIYDDFGHSHHDIHRRTCMDTSYDETGDALVGAGALTRHMMSRVTLEVIPTHQQSRVIRHAWC